MEKKRTLKSLILEYVSNELNNDATYTQIIRFAHDYRNGKNAWEKNENRRGWFSNAMDNSWVYTKDDPEEYLKRVNVGYLVKRHVASGWLEKKENGRYKVGQLTKNELARLKK